MESYEKAYSPKEISVSLDIGDSTLRKWAIALEKQGYSFIRNDQNKRIFVDADFVILRHFKQLVQDHNMQLSNAAMLVIDRFGKGPLQPRTGIVPADHEENDRDSNRSNDDYFSKLMEYIERQDERIEAQEQFNKELLQKLEQQQKYIQEQLTKRDDLLMQSIRESQETKQLLLETTAKQQESEQQKKPRKGLLRLFSKD